MCTGILSARVSSNIRLVSLMRQPHGHWWIKSDGFDVMMGLMESTRGGDIVISLMGYAVN